SPLARKRTYSRSSTSLSRASRRSISCWRNHFFSRTCPQSGQNFSRSNRRPRRCPISARSQSASVSYRYGRFSETGIWCACAHLRASISTQLSNGMSHSSPPITHHGRAIRYASSIAVSPYRWACQARYFWARAENCSAIATILHLVQLLVGRAEHVVPAHRACPFLDLAVGQVAAAMLVGHPTAVDALTRVL